MHEQSREILPVAVTDLGRRIEIEHEILAQITESLTDPIGLSNEAQAELERSKDQTLRSIGNIAAELLRREAYAA